MHPTSVLIFALLPVCDGIFGVGRLQSVAVMGTLRCKGQPASKVRVKLFDKEIFFDKELGSGKVGRNGTFLLTGSMREFTHIEPYVNIYHKCNYDGQCVKKRTISIPDEYISFGSIAYQIFNLGIVNLEKVHAERIDCDFTL